MPAAGAQQYDPSSPTPYQAPALPDPQPAMPSPLPTQMPDINGAVKKSGAIATVADGILRGFMQGRAYHQASEVMKLKKKTDDLQNSYNQDAVRLYQLTQAGVDPKSDEYKAAKSSVDGSWGALMDFYGTHIEQMTGDKKGKKKKTDQQLPPQAVLTNPTSTPFEKAQAWYQVSKQAGPPVYGQVAMLKTPEAQAGRQASALGAQNALTKEQAQATRDELAGIPEEKLTPAQREQLSRANAILFPPRQTGATRLYKGPSGESEWYLPGEEPQGFNAVQSGATKPYKLKDGSEQWFVPGSEPQGATAVVGSSQTPKPGTFGDFLIKKYGADYTADDYLKALHESRQAGHIAGAGRGGDAEDKSYAKWDSYYKEHYPEMGFEERDALVRHKVEGASQEQSGVIAHDAVAEPQQFDNDVLSAAIDKLRALPQYKDMTTFDDALANLVGQGDNGYQYHSRSNLGQPDKGGKYSGDVTGDQLKTMERDLQTQIRAILSGPKETALSPEARRAVVSRMAPLFGPAAPAGSGTSPVSPQANAAPPAAGASSPSPQGGLPPQAKARLKKGEVTAFANGQEWTLGEDGNPKQVK